MFCCTSAGVSYQSTKRTLTHQVWSYYLSLMTSCIVTCHVSTSSDTHVDGIPTKQLGPVNSWWIAGFDGGEKALIGFDHHRSVLTCDPINWCYSAPPPPPSPPSIR